MSMLKRAQPAADEDEGYHSRHVMLQIEMGAEAGHESQRHTPSTYGGTVSRWSFYDLYIRHIRHPHFLRTFLALLFVCVHLLFCGVHWLRRAQRPRSAEGADEEERVGQTSEQYREVILQVLQYLSISYICPHSYTPCIFVLPHTCDTCLSDAVARLAGFRPTAKVQEALWKIGPPSQSNRSPTCAHEIRWSHTAFHLSYRSLVLAETGCKTWKSDCKSRRKKKSVKSKSSWRRTACFQTISSRKGDAEIFGKLSESKLFHSCFKCVVWQDVFQMWKDVKRCEDISASQLVQEMKKKRQSKRAGLKPLGPVSCQSLESLESPILPSVVHVDFWRKCWNSTGWGNGKRGSRWSAAKGGRLERLTCYQHGTNMLQLTYDNAYHVINKG